MEVTTENANDAAVAIRICRKPGCGKPLGPTNRSGNCTAHCHYDKPRPGRSSANGHAKTVPAGTNGHATEIANASIHELAGDFRADRLDRLILGFPVAVKAKIATAWLRGEI